MGEEVDFSLNLVTVHLKMLPLILVSYIVGLTVEFAFAIYRGHQVNEGYLVTGLLIPMIMPFQYHYGCWLYL